MVWAENILRGLLNKLVTRGSLEVELYNGTRWVFGDGSGQRVVVRIADKATAGELIRDPEVRFGELYMDGRLDVVEGTLYDLLKLLLQHGTAMRSFTGRKLLLAARKVRHVLFGRNTLGRSRRNVVHHYDLDAAFYDLFLDADRQYSCAYFASPELTLEEAQRAKCRHLAAKLLVEPGMSVLDIGSGWGGLGLYLAEVGGAGQVKGVTLSDEQLAIARKRAADKGYEHVKFELEDYRNTRGTFDRIISVGMFEHVGPQNYDTFFRKTADLLAENGVFMLHTIGHTSTPGLTNGWITKYIFPGGHLPALSEVVTAVEKSGLMMADVEVLRHHYADTLREWRARFMAQRDKALALYDERFCRMWECYLAMCEAAFRFLDVVVYQFQLTHRNDVVPITRDYIPEREAQLLAREKALGEPTPARSWRDRAAVISGG
ncbi:SAM-dependent methyltransferase [Pleomorphomonas koreensis]|uniref:SAM-dependent methyltransferase n=1 Tax=Pleomorphomonas koreensis TaxID=257440 RepID=UPI0004269BBD|nr:cyclopropane-fatty-acyl-phospholipid synthase family protein [Pleomorphomonas koreensis]